MNGNMHPVQQEKDYTYQGSANPGKVAAAARQYAREGDYWLNKLSGSLVNATFPYDNHDNREPGPTATPAQPPKNLLTFNLNGNTYAQLMRLTGGSDPKLHIVAAAVLALLLYRYTGHNDIILGTPIYKQKIAGEFVNTALALRTYIHEQMSFKELLLQLRQTYIEAFENQNYPIETLMYKLNKTPSANGSPLFEIAVILENIQDKTYLRHIHTNMTFSLMRREHDIAGQVEYNPSYYGEATMARIIAQYRHLLEQTLLEPETRVPFISILPEEEKKKLLYEFNNSEEPDLDNKTIAERFAEQATRTPAKTAVVYKDPTAPTPYILTYEELNEKAGNLAQIFREYGVNADTIAAIMVEPSLEMIVAIMAVLKSGGAYLPIDADNPETRVKFILDDSRPAILISDRKDPAAELSPLDIPVLAPTVQDRTGEKKVGTGHIRMETGQCPAPTCSPFARSPQPGANPFNLAYIIYTSGTTGKPKGVLVENKNVINYVTWFSNKAGLTAADKTLLTSSFAFDLGYTSLYSSLLNGCELHLLRREFYLEAELLLGYIKENAITYIKATPSFFSIIVNSPAFSLETRSTLRLAVLGGEPINTKDVEKAFAFCNHLKIMNHYGPTETTIGSVAHMIDIRGREGFVKVPVIGGPISNTRVYILGKSLEILPLGVSGELCIAGQGVGRGYLNRPDLTAEKFHRDLCDYWDNHDKKFLRGSPGGAVFSKSAPPGRRRQKIYRTGDLARWLSNGTLEFLGRIDHQVKIRGYRIETGEIESSIHRHREVKEAIVIAGNDINNNTYLCAYYAAPAAVTAHELKQFLARILPDYMMPSYFVHLEEMPLTPNGKIDRTRLPKPELKAEDNLIPPGTEIEKKMAALWAEVLGQPLNIIGIETDFFELGGHSLMATILVSKLRKEFAVNVPLAEIFKTPTIRMLSKYILEAEKGVFTLQDDNLVLLRKGDNTTRHIFLVHAGSGVVEGYREVCNMLTPAFNYWGIQADQLENYTPRNLTNGEVAVHYIEKMKKIQPHGPYYIVGWCIGGTIAFEMANRLEHAGETINLLVLLNSIAPEKNLLPMDVVDFTHEAELTWIKRNFPEGEFKETLLRTTRYQQIWPAILDYLEKNNYDKETVLKLFAVILKHERPLDKDPIPNFERLTLRELIYFLGVIRTYRKVRAAYLPSDKIQTQVHFVAARKSEITNRECWNNYCVKPVQFYETPGGHFSMWQQPDALEFACLFNRLIQESQ